jgi:hypothetical protein
MHEPPVEHLQSPGQIRNARAGGFSWNTKSATAKTTRHYLPVGDSGPAGRMTKTQQNRWISSGTFSADR